jgi:hypothetical protein
VKRDRGALKRGRKERRERRKKRKRRRKSERRRCIRLEKMCGERN